MTIKVLFIGKPLQFQNQDDKQRLNITAKQAYDSAPVYKNELTHLICFTPDDLPKVLKMLPEDPEKLREYPIIEAEIECPSDAERDVPYFSENQTEIAMAKEIAMNKITKFALKKLTLSHNEKQITFNAGDLREYPKSLGDLLIDETFQKAQQELKKIVVLDNTALIARPAPEIHKPIAKPTPKAKPKSSNPLANFFYRAPSAPTLTAAPIPKPPSEQETYLKEFKAIKNQFDYLILQTLYTQADCRIRQRINNLVANTAHPTFLPDGSKVASTLSSKLDILKWLLTDYLNKLALKDGQTNVELVRSDLALDVSDRLNPPVVVAAVVNTDVVMEPVAVSPILLSQPNNNNGKPGLSIKRSPSPPKSPVAEDERETKFARKDKNSSKDSDSESGSSSNREEEEVEVPTATPVSPPRKSGGLFK